MRATIDIEAEITALGDLSRVELAALWEKAYKCPPSPGIRQELLIRSAAWHMQAKRLCGYSAETRRLLKAAIDQVEKKLVGRINPPVGPHVSRAPADDVDTLFRDKPTRSRRQLLPGTRLLRDWNGRTHIVDVLESGFAFEAKVYPSLSVIARKITGTHWSGPRFFGL